MFLAATAVQAQITIGGNVYGGGNAGDTGGNTKVVVYSGDLKEVFGGARIADVKGYTSVNIDGEHASDNIIINKVYGGNDIAGTISGTDASRVQISTKTTTTGEGPTAVVSEADDAKKIFIGQLYGGGNGDYTYTANTEETGTFNITIEGTSYTKVKKPVLSHTYLDIKGGTIAHLYGGGNAATITGSTTISIDNPSKVVTSIVDVSGKDILADPEGTRLKEMGLNTTQVHASSSSFQFGRVFGGNNKEAMAIRPTWNLVRGKIRDLYSGGNAGAMTYYDTSSGKGGILLSINPTNSDDLKIGNVFGGCRMADVNPDDHSIAEETIDGMTFPAGYAARVLIMGGDIGW